MKWIQTESASENARRELPKVTRKFFDAGRKAGDKASSHGDLHKFRLKVKQYRYTLEIFRPLYGPGLQAKLEVLQDMQQILGKMSDAFTIRDLVTDDAELSKQLEDRGQKKIREFRSFWTDKFDAPGQEDSWVLDLRRYAKRSRKQ